MAEMRRLYRQTRTERGSLYNINMFSAHEIPTCNAYCA